MFDSASTLKNPLENKYNQFLLDLKKNLKKHYNSNFVYKNVHNNKNC